MKPVDFLKVLLATFLWGSTFPLIKTELAVADPAGFAGLRFCLSGVMLLAAAMVWHLVFRRGEQRVADVAPVAATPQWGRVILIGFLATGLCNGLYFHGMARTSATSASLLDGAGPIVSSIMAHFALRDDRLNRRKLVAILVAFVGITLISLTRTEGGDSRAVSAIGCALIVAALSFGAAGTILVITYRGSLGLVRLTGYQQLFAGLMLLVLSAFSESGRHWTALANPKFVATVVWLAIVSAVAFRLWYGVVRRYKVTSVAVYTFLVSVWGAGLSITVLAEPFTLNHMIGGALVVSALLVMFRGGGEALRPVQPLA